MSRTLLLLLALVGGAGPAAHAQGSGPLVPFIRTTAVGS